MNCVGQAPREGRFAFRRGNVPPGEAERVIAALLPLAPEQASRGFGRPNDLAV
jgi:hypothetical protein